MILAGNNANACDFAQHCAEDRHHFRFIVVPKDAAELGDLKAFTRGLMAQAERDLGTKLDWVAVDHWNTAQSHIHVLVRGKTDRVKTSSLAATISVRDCDCESSHS